jgi:hypothetical protein
MCLVPLAVFRGSFGVRVSWPARMNGFRATGLRAFVLRAWLPVFLSKCENCGR